MKTFSYTLTLGIALATLAAMVPNHSRAANKIPDQCKVSGFAIGCQAYSFNRFTVFEAIEKTAQAGGRIIEFYPGQKLSKEGPKVVFNHDSPPEVVQQIKDALAKHHVKAVNYGVVAIPNDEAKARKVFEFARDMGIYGITTESEKSLDLIEKLVKEYDIKVGFHNHPKQEKNPNYQMWDPQHVLGLLKNRDARIGVCADTGHWASSGLKPLDCIKLLKGRIVSLHLKERTAIGQHLPDTIFGTGVLDIKGTLDELKRQHFDGNISIEYEANWDNSVPDITKCIDFVRNYGAKK